MPHPVAEPVATELPRVVFALPAGQALLSDEEWQALLWPTPPQPCDTSATQAGDLS